MAAERIQKLIARAGLASRRQAEELITHGRVTVNGRRARLGDQADPGHDRVEVDGVPIDVAGDVVVYALHKPRGVVTTSSDPQGRPTVVALVPPAPRVFPVGRLDADSEGLLLLTNDGELGQLIAHPSHGVPKTYLVDVRGRLGRDAISRMRRGVDLPDGRTAPAMVRVVQPGGERLALEVVIHEGRNRQVRRMVEAVGATVSRLVRTAVGPVHLGRLKAGQWRKLGPTEVAALRRATMQRTPDQR